MQVAHYQRNRETREQRAARLARIREQAVVALTPRPAVASEPSLRGIGVVTPPRKVKYRRPRHVRRNEGYYASNGAFIAYAEAPYTEFSRDVAQGRTKRTTPAPSTRTVAPMSRAARDIALMQDTGHYIGNVD